MKKILTLLLCAALIFSLAACTDSPEISDTGSQSGSEGSGDVSVSDTNSGGTDSSKEEDVPAVYDPNQDHLVILGTDSPKGLMVLDLEKMGTVDDLNHLEEALVWQWTADSPSSIRYPESAGSAGAKYRYSAYWKKDVVLCVNSNGWVGVIDYETKDFEGYLGTLYSKTGKVAALGNTPDTVRAYFATATIAFLAFYAIEVYIDGTLSVNDPSKVLRQITFMICAAFFVFEARISLGREMWRLYTAFGLVAASLTAYTSIPAIVTYYVNGEIINSPSVKSLASLEEYILLLALFIFIVSRLCLTAFLKEEKENALVKALGEYAKDREERVNDSYERFQEVFASKQLSIFDLYGGDEELSETEKAEDDTAEIAPEEEKKEITISDDAIYEAIFGKMPERPVENEADDEAYEPEDERAPEQIAEDILSAVDEALKESPDNNEKETEI